MSKRKQIESDEQYEITIHKIIDHRSDGQRLEYKVVYDDGSTKGKKWVFEKNLLNCNELISGYWYQKNQKSPSNMITDEIQRSKTKSSDESRKVLSSKSKITKSVKDMNVDEYDVDGAMDNSIDDLAVNVEYCDPFAEATNIKHKKSMHYDDDSDDDDIQVPKRKKLKIGPNDVVAEVENILECRVVNGNKNYLIKWVGCKSPTWIYENDFIEHKLLNEFNRYEHLRNDPSVHRRAYIYCRTSKRNVDKEVSLQDQERYCLNYAKRNNINVIGVFKDNGVSAKEMTNQFALNFVCDRIRKGECILFYDISRFSRSMMQALEKLEYIRLKVGAIAHSVHDGITWNNVATSRASFRQNLSNSQLHSEVISEKVISSIEFRKERGDHIGYVPFGYKTQLISGVRKLVKNDNEMTVIKRIFDLAMDQFFDKLSNLNLGSDEKPKKKSNRAPKKTVAMKRKFKTRIHDTTPKECQDIAKIVNDEYTNRNDKPFTWRFIRSTLIKWKDNI